MQRLGKTFCHDVLREILQGAGLGGLTKAFAQSGVLHQALQGGSKGHNILGRKDQAFLIMPHNL